MRILIAAAALAAAAGANAQDIRVNADQAISVRLASAAKSVIIGNPLIAEVMLIDERTVYVLGRMAGQTNLVAVDQNGTEIVNQKVSVRVGDQQIVTLHKGNSGPRTYSCAPKCEWVVMPGDEGYKSIQEDADKKQQQSDNASQIATKR
jgi:Pilus formation protein N terminal region